MVLAGWSSWFKLRIMPLVLLGFCGLSAPPALAGQFEQKILTAKSYPNSRNRQYQVFDEDAIAECEPVQSAG